MTPEEKVIMLQNMTDETDPAVLASYLTLAQQIIFTEAYPYGNYPETMPEQYDAVHVEIAAYMINKQGAEGELVHLENGISRHWENGSIPGTLLRRITPLGRRV